MNRSFCRPCVLWLTQATLQQGRRNCGRIRRGGACRVASYEANFFGSSQSGEINR